MKNLILEQISKEFYKLGEELGFKKRVVRHSGPISEIYVLNKHALQIEVDWHENDLFMYVVYLKNKSLPDDSVIYSYDDGHWCRKYLEGIYKAKHPVVKNKNIRYSSEYLLDCFDFYKRLIATNPSILKDFGNGDESIIVNESGDAPMP